MSDASEATGDSSLSASELRQRYNRGGTARDDELSASQLRARHGVQKNRPNFSTDSPADNTLFIVVGAFAFVFVLAYFLFSRKNME